MSWPIKQTSLEDGQTSLRFGQTSLSTLSKGGGGLGPLSQWIFADGTWSDAGKWQDDRPWAVTGLFINNQWWDGGQWSDAMVW